jgi:hypothetical protein
LQRGPEPVLDEVGVGALLVKLCKVGRLNRQIGVTELHDGSVSVETVKVRLLVLGVVQAVCVVAGHGTGGIGVPVGLYEHVELDLVAHEDLGRGVDFVLVGNIHGDGGVGGTNVLVVPAPHGFWGKVGFEG